jgi:peroxiredoxin
MPLNIGDAAPDFTLFNTEKQAINLSSYQGKNVVILFFPLAFTSTCTAELCGVRDDISNYGKMDAEILAISVDSLFTLGKFKEEQGLNFNLLSDFNKTVSQSYGSLYDTFVLDMKGVSKRSAFLVDREGIVRYAEVLESASDVPNLDALKEVLKSL